MTTSIHFPCCPTSLPVICTEIDKPQNHPRRRQCWSQGPLRSVDAASFHSVRANGQVCSVCGHLGHSVCGKCRPQLLWTIQRSNRTAQITEPSSTALRASWLAQRAEWLAVPETEANCAFTWIFVIFVEVSGVRLGCLLLVGLSTIFLMFIL